MSGRYTPPPLVSVVMPVFNAAPYLTQAVDSILGQSLDDLELIAVNDGSSDDSAGILAQYRDPRLITLSQPHRGVFTAMNAGIARARGVYLARMDADDIAHRDRLTLEQRLLEEMDIDIAGSRVEVFSTDGNEIPGQKRYAAWINGLLRHEDIVQNIFIEDPMPSPTLFTRHKTILALGGYDEGVYPDDYNLTLKAFRQGLRFGKHPEILLKWRDHPARLSRNAPELRQQRFFDIKARYFAEAFCRTDRKIILWGLGKNGKSLYKALLSAGVSVHGFTASPEFIREKSLYGKPIRTCGEYERPFFLLATAAREGRESAEKTLTGLGFAPTRDFLAFC